MPIFFSKNMQYFVGFCCIHKFLDANRIDLLRSFVSHIKAHFKSVSCFGFCVSLLSSHNISLVKVWKENFEKKFPDNNISQECKSKNVKNFFLIRRSEVCGPAHVWEVYFLKEHLESAPTIVDQCMSPFYRLVIQDKTRSSVQDNCSAKCLAPVMSSILPCPPCLLHGGSSGGLGVWWGARAGGGGGGLGEGRGVRGGGGWQGTFHPPCHILHYHMVLRPLHYHMVLRPKGTSHNYDIAYI